MPIVHVVFLYHFWVWQYIGTDAYTECYWVHCSCRISAYQVWSAHHVIIVLVWPHKQAQHQVDYKLGLLLLSWSNTPNCRRAESRLVSSCWNIDTLFCTITCLVKLHRIQSYLQQITIFCDVDIITIITILLCLFNSHQWILSNLML